MSHHCDSLCWDVGLRRVSLARSQHDVSTMTALFFLALLALSSQQAHSALTSVRVAFLTDCKWYSDWQSLGMIYSFKMSGQPGKVTR